MRQGQQGKRMRGRNRKGPNPLTRSYESNGPDVKIRGTAIHIAEKYMTLARDAHSSGDRVGAESYLQHAEHYYRIVAAAQAQLPQQQQQPNPRGDDDTDDDGDEQQSNGNGQGGQPAFGLSDPQPYVNGGGQDQPENGGQGRAQGSGESGGRSDGSREHRDGDQQAGAFRGRRRRPYRDRQGERGGEGGGGEGDSQPAVVGAADSAQNDD
jgi:hypothetical protein